MNNIFLLPLQLRITRASERWKMNLYKIGNSIGTSRRQRIQQQGFRKRSSPPAFVKSFTRIVFGFLGLLSILYAIALRSLFAIDNESLQQLDDGKPVIAIASTITGCGKDPFVDGAAVLKYNLDVHAQRPDAKFRYHHYVFYHPEAKECVLPLADLGYTLLEKPTPVRVEDIGGDGGLRERIVNNGCCGEKELIKLEAFRLTNHPIVVHLDLDVVIPKPMDDVLDFMMHPQKFKDSPELLSKIPIMWPKKDIPENIQFLFTKDYNVVAPKRHDKPYQGGFFVIKPSLEIYNEFVDIVKSGDYNVKKGWGKKVGPFYGGMTIQGLFPWYYEYVRKGVSVELNRCKYNNMNDNPYLVRDNGDQRCRTNEEKCEDCRYTSPEEVVSFHFTICQKPWNCLKFAHHHEESKLCRDMNQKWYEFRSELEASWGRTGKGQGSFMTERYQGYCARAGIKGYEPIRKPYGAPGLQES